MDRKGLEINMSREEVGMDDISKRLVHNKVCNVTVKRNKNKLENALAVIQELVKSGRLHAEGEVETIRTPERLKEYMDHCKQSGEYVLDVETTGLDIYNDILVGICLYTPGETSAYVPFNHTDLQNVRVADQMSEEQVRDIVIPYLQDQELRCINHNIKFDNKKLAWDWKQIIVNIYWDTLIAGYVLNENEPHGLKPLYNKYILHGKGSSEDYGDLFEGIPFNYVPIEVAKRKMRACRKKMENNIPPTYSEWCSFNSYKGWLGNCDSYRLSKKYIEPLIDYMQDYYEKEVKGHAEVYRGFLQCG